MFPPVLIYSYFAIAAFLVASGQAFDSITLLTQPLEFTLSSTSISSLFYLPLRIFNIFDPSLSCIISLVLSSLFAIDWCKRYLKFIQCGLLGRLTSYSFFLPFIYIYLILPSKEQVFAVTYVFLFTKLTFATPSAKTLQKLLFYFTILALLSILLLCRPFSVLLLPLTFLLSSVLNSIIIGNHRFHLSHAFPIGRIKIVVFRATKVRYIAFVLFFIFLLLLLAFRDSVYDSIQQILFQTAYETGTTSSRLLESRGMSAKDIIVWDLVKPWFIAVLTGYPYFFSDVLSIGPILISIAYSFSLYFVLLPSAYIFVSLLLRSGYTLPGVLFVLAPAILAFIVCTVALTVNSGTGIRYFGNFFFVVWLIRFYCDRIVKIDSSRSF